MGFDEVADELYRGPPEEFTAARDAAVRAARKAGERRLAAELKELRRPTRAAWVSNTLVRERPEEVGPLVELGEALRRAQAELDGAGLRELGARQHAVVGAMAQEAGRLASAAGRPVGDDVLEEVRRTLHAVLADPEAARRWAEGRLVRPLRAEAGFPAVGAGPGAEPGAVRDLGAARERRRAREARAGRREAERRAAEERRAERERRRGEERRAAVDAERAVAARRAELEAARERLAGARERADALAEELAAAREAVAAAEEGERAARAAVGDAERAARRAGRRRPPQ
ncbi:hypothetical protein [Streptomyces chumphonensis]|uniref:hypothetical protein n=1 Tax=Streptomyces chumphonensis TaxID=1214925 RepID=UPI003D7589DF